MANLYNENKLTSYSQLAKKLGTSRARVTQMLNLLKLCGEVQKIVVGLGDYWGKRIVTERQLRRLVKMNYKSQIDCINKMTL
ncbi:hypothetical protein UABAM_04558 [Candidatus Uabimicrobium amorphum]|uniref:ParB/Spo0J HTH domain-containing protein n=1 Tax=Uabimicrobium amorphum TaxID=2596890 RepID=A0A5S9F6E1_UABAM|nr:hypothetical protein UABAM_04558 [Candidatus Uabimicrobium amorphum]